MPFKCPYFGLINPFVFDELNFDASIKKIKPGLANQNIGLSMVDSIVLGKESFHDGTNRRTLGLSYRSDRSTGR